MNAYLKICIHSVWREGVMKYVTDSLPTNPSKLLIPFPCSARSFVLLLKVLIALRASYLIKGASLIKFSKSIQRLSYELNLYYIFILSPVSLDARHRMLSLPKAEGTPYIKYICSFILSAFKGSIWLSLSIRTIRVLIKPLNSYAAIMKAKYYTQDVID